MGIFQDISIWYDNGIYYPEIFLFVISIFIILVVTLLSYCSYKSFEIFRHIQYLSKRSKLSAVLKDEYIKIFRQYKTLYKILNILLKILSRFYEFVINTKNKICNYSIRNPVTIFTAVLFIMIFTRIWTTYITESRVVVAPEKIFQSPRVGNDFNLGVLIPAILMTHGANFYSYSATYGPSFTLFTIPFLDLSRYLKLCPSNDWYSCLVPLYQWLLLATIIGYILFILYLTHIRPKDISLFLLFFVTFILGIPGSLGIERGNIDIILALFFGIILVILHKSVINKFSRHKYIYSLILGLLASFISNSKIFFIPFSIITIIASPNIAISVTTYIISFSIFSYLPNIYGASTSFLDLFKAAIFFNKQVTFTGLDSIRSNHSFSSLASLATNCIYKQACNSYEIDINIIRSLNAILFIITFIFPFLSEKAIINSIYRYKIFSFSGGIFKVFLRWKQYTLQVISILVKNRQSFKFILFYFILINAAVNLLLRISFDYRLYFSLPIVYLLWIISEKNKRARLYCLLSMLFLLVKSFWLMTVLHPEGMTVYDPRFMNLFVVLHYYYSIKSGIALTSSKTI